VIVLRRFIGSRLTEGESFHDQNDGDERNRQADFLRLVKVRIQLGPLFTQCLEFGRGFGLGRAIGLFNPGGKSTQIPVDLGQPDLPVRDPFSSFHIGLILHLLRGRLRFLLHRVQLPLRGLAGLSRLGFRRRFTAHRPGDEGEAGDGALWRFHGNPVFQVLRFVRSGKLRYAAGLS
jgi:hypothetical protein